MSALQDHLARLAKPPDFDLVDAAGDVPELSGSHSSEISPGGSFDWRSLLRCLGGASHDECFIGDRAFHDSCGGDLY